MNPTFCRGCGKPVRFYKTRFGSWACIDPDPDPQGTIKISVVMNTAETVERGSRTPLYRPHRETCTNPWKRT